MKVEEIVVANKKAKVVTHKKTTMRPDIVKF